MAPAVHRVLGNRWVIDVDQDPLGEPGRRVRDEGDVEIWARPLANGDTAVALFNRSAQATRIRTDVREVGAEHRHVYLVWDLWKKRPFPPRGS